MWRFGVFWEVVHSSKFPSKILISPLIVGDVHHLTTFAGKVIPLVTGIAIALGLDYDIFLVAWSAADPWTAEIVLDIYV